MVNSQQVSMFQPVVTRSAWHSDKYKDSKQWLVQLAPEHLVELRAAVDLHKRVPENALHKLTASDFPLPTLSAVLRDVREDIVNGKGFAILSGISTVDYHLRYCSVYTGATGGMIPDHLRTTLTTLAGTSYLHTGPLHNTSARSKSPTSMDI